MTDAPKTAKRRDDHVLDAEGGVRYELRTLPRRNGVITQEMVQEIQGVERSIMAWACNTREAGVREALIQLGWTPPPEEQKDQRPAECPHDPTCTSWIGKRGDCEGKGDCTI